MARLWLLLLVVLLASPAVMADPPGTIDPGSVGEGRRLVDLVSAEGHFRLTHATSREIVLSLYDGDGPIVGALNLNREAQQHVARFRSRHYAITASNFSRCSALA